jgi:chromosome segregation ATPase
VDELRSGDIERLLNTETESLRSQLAAANSELASMKARVAELTIRLGEALEQGIKLDERNRKLERKLDNLD